MTVGVSERSSDRVIIYRTRYCPYCVMAERLLSAAGIAFEEIDVSGDPERRRWLARVSGRRTVPQIFVGERAIGGYDELRALLRAGPAALFSADSEQPSSG